MIDYLKHFPYQHIRKEQDYVLKQIAENWDNKKYFILQLDVGTGKSGIAKTVANWSKNAFIITETKQLQDQYINDFGSDTQFVSIKGKANYQCVTNPKLNCENGPCSLRKIGTHPGEHLPECMNRCKYFTLRNRALKSHTVLTSYAYIFRAFDCAGFWKSRDLMVFDECHLIEDQIVNFSQFDLNIVKLNNEYNLFDETETIDSQLTTFTQVGWEANEAVFWKIYDVISSKRLALWNSIVEEYGDVDINTIDEDVIETINSTHKVYYKLDKLWKKMEVFIKQSKSNWIIEPNETGDTLIFTPIFINSLFNQFCNNWANKFLFMSATILDTDGFINDLGINKDECLVIKVESSFDPNKSPIYYSPCGSMSYQNINNTLPVVCDRIKGILAHTLGEKGIIHTGNYKVANYIYNNVRNDRLLMKTDNETSNYRLIQIHEMRKDSVLLSPSMTTGVDLKDDLSRFQIIVKMPFTSLVDKRTKKKSELSPDWYACQMLKTLVQACGRSTRSAEDYSNTIVLDTSFKYWILKYKHWLPNQFLQRIRGF